jgi:hypothetical protein
MNTIFRRLMITVCVFIEKGSRMLCRLVMSVESRVRNYRMGIGLSQEAFLAKTLAWRVGGMG